MFNDLTTSDDADDVVVVGFAVVIFLSSRLAVTIFAICDQILSLG